MSCLSNDAYSHFERREQELLALNQELEDKRANAFAEAAGAIRDAESSSLHGRVYRPPADAGAPDGEPQRSSPEPPGQPPSRAGVAGLSGVGASRSSGHSTSSRPPSGNISADPGSADALHQTIRFQNARILALQDELDKTIHELTAREGEVSQLKKELKQVTDEHKKVQKVASSAEQTQDRAKKDKQAAEAKASELEQERIELRKERDQALLERKKADAESSKQEAKANRLAEECEKYKAQLKDFKCEDRERGATDRKEVDRLTNEVRKLERQRTELVAAFKKQMRLIDVLKKQRAHVEAARVLSFTEDEFIRVLELGDKLDE